MATYDLIIRNGTIVDGTGAPRFTGDVGIKDGLIAAVGKVHGDAAQEIDAGGKVVAPGWVDVHTHYDGQATWDQEMSPSSWHGVTTVIMGNCGVGFAPAAPDRHEWLIRLMEGVEDIPGTALAEGMKWDWETFPEYLDALERLPRTVDVGTHVPHGMVRCAPMCWATASARAPFPRRRTSKRWPTSSRTGCAPGPWAFRPAAPSCTARSTVKWCPAPPQPRKN
jgi:N-acyl-D-aspartate/D-glutamate deacylase